MRLGQLNRRMFFEADDGGGAGGGGGDDPGGGGKPNDKTFDYETWLKEQPDDVRSALIKHGEESAKGLKSALEKEREARKALEKAQSDIERQKKAAEDAALEEQKKYQELAESRGKKLVEIEPQLKTLVEERDALKTKADAQDQTLKEFLDAEIEALKLDDATKELLEGKTVVESLAWIAKHKQTLGKKRADGAPPTPPGDHNNGLSAEEKLKKSRPVSSYI